VSSSTQQARDSSKKVFPRTRLYAFLWRSRLTPPRVPESFSSTSLFVPDSLRSKNTQSDATAQYRGRPNLKVLSENDPHIAHPMHGAEWSAPKCSSSHAATTHKVFFSLRSLGYLCHARPFSSLEFCPLYVCALRLGQPPLREMGGTGQQKSTIVLKKGIHL